MIVGLYDVDLWHSPRRFPNLELMKTYSYYYKNNTQVIMMNPQTDEGRFNKIIYFKDKPFTDIPLELSLSGENKQRFGYGFYGEDSTLPPEIQQVEPTFLPYDSYSNRLLTKDYEKLRRSSIIRLSTNDFTGMNDYRLCFVVDRNPAANPQIFQLFKDYPQKKFQFFESLKIYSEEEIEPFKPYFKQLNSRLILKYNYSPEFFAAYCDEYDKYIFDTSLRPEESNEHYLERIVKMTLLMKKKKLQTSFSFAALHDEMSQAIRKWTLDLTQLSFQDFYAGQPEERYVFTAPASLRILLKKKPLSTRSQDIDFWN